MPSATRSTVVVLACLCAALFLAGCQDAKQLAVAHRTYAVTVNALSDAREQGKISDATQANVVAPARDASKAILDAATTAYVTGERVNWYAVLAALNQAMTPLVRQREVLEATNAPAD